MTTNENLKTDSFKFAFPYLEKSCLIPRITGTPRTAIWRFLPVGYRIQGEYWSGEFNKGRG